ncbi:MAG: hypothetical protein LAT57_14060, partial [Balneolales bacterium]|nr:hypothetical protein [Balneolales bacterium]
SKSSTMKIFFSTLLFLSFTIVSYSQVTVSPTAVFLENNFGSVVIINNTQISQDILLSFEFGYPVSDELGEVTMLYGTDNDKAEFDISDNLRIFPRALTLAPGQRQTARINFRPNRDISNGVHWTRLRVTSTPESVEIADTDEESVSTQLSFVFEQVIGVYHRNGQVETKLEVSNATFASDRILYTTSNTGNAPFIGTVNYTLQKGNETVLQGRQVTSIFTNGNRSIAVPEGLESGQYKLSLNIVSERPDVPQNFRFPMQPVSQEFTITIP